MNNDTLYEVKKSAFGDSETDDENNISLMLGFIRLKCEEREAIIQQWNDLINTIPKKAIKQIIECLINSFFLAEKSTKEKIIKLIDNASSFLEIECFLQYMDILITETDETCRNELMEIINHRCKNDSTERVKEFYMRNQEFISCGNQSVCNYKYDTRILFIIPYFLSRKGFVQPPLDAMISAALLKKKGYKVSILDLRVNKVDYTKIKATNTLIFVSMCPYDVIQNYPVDYKFENTVSIINFLTQELKLNVIAYGPYFDVNKDAIEKLCFPTKFIEGPIEDSVIKECDIFFSSNYDPINIDSINVIPAYELVDLTKYYCDFKERISPWVAVLSNRGCPYSCRFCYSYFGKVQKKRRVESIIQELEILEKKFNVRDCFFLDSTFTLDKKWVEEFCTQFAKKGLSISWQIETRIDCLDERIIRMLAEAGCKRIYLGVEALDDEMLNFLSKRTTLNQINSIIECLNKEPRVEYEVFLMAGLPNQTIDDLYDEYKMLKDMKITNFQFITYMPRPKTYFYKLACEEYPYLNEDFRYLSCARGRVHNNIKNSDLVSFFDFIRRK